MLAERVAQWKQEFINQGRIEGREEGIVEGKRQGMAEGKKQGIAEGEARGRQKIIMTVVKNMLAGSLSIDDIANFTGLSAQDVQQLANQKD